MTEYSGLIGFLDRWQTLIGALAAGIFGYAAAIWTVRRTLQSESRKDARELRSMKTALGAEVREFASQALSSHRGCVALVTARSSFPIQRLEDLGRFPEPVVYPNSVARLGLIGDEAHWVVDFFARIQHFRQGIVVMRSLPLPESIAPINAEPSASALLDACEAAVFVLPALREGDLYKAQDAKFSAAVAAARAEWKPEQKLNRNLEKGRG